MAFETVEERDRFRKMNEHSHHQRDDDRGQEILIFIDSFQYHVAKIMVNYELCMMNGCRCTADYCFWICAVTYIPGRNCGFVSLMEAYTSSEREQIRVQIMANFILKLVVLFVFGFWYAVRENKWHYRPDYRPLFTVKRIAGLTAIGLFGQYAIGITVGFLRYLLPNIFASYDNVSEILSLKNGSPFAVLLLVVVVGPIAEELLFRGVIYGGLRTCFPVDVSALVSALIFGIYHKNIVQGLYAAAFGIILAYIFEKTQSIWGSTLMHMAFNLSSYLISGIGQWLAYRQIRIASIWYVIFYVLCIVVVAASIYSLRRLPNRYDEIRKRNGDVEG